MVRSRPTLSTGVVPVYLGDLPLFLVLRVYRYWDFPKGLVERKETPLQAALRELKEETTLIEVEFPWGSDFIETEPYSYGKIARYYLGQVTTLQVSLPINPLLGHA